MSIITKEWLQQKIADMEAARDEIPFGLDEDDSNTLAALRIALASLEAEKCAEPVAFINGAWTLVYYRPPKELGLKVGDKLYTAPPAPVVPDMAAVGEMPFLGTQEKAFVSGWNACRAAMLQSFGNSEQLNSPVIPDCSCGTCRPVTFTDSRFVVCSECGNKRCPHANDHQNACTGSNEPGQEGSAYPAAPQQEVTQALAKGMERYGDAMNELAKREVKP